MKGESVYPRSLMKGAAALAAALFCSAALAAVTPEEAAQLEGRLSPLGAERAGNVEGSIPEWTGGITKAPACYKGQFMCDPFPGDKPLFEITATNMHQHTERLSPGLIAMLEKYPTFKIPVYETRRTAAFPQKVYDLTRQNATRTELVESGYGMRDLAAAGIPFPVPKNGLEAVWNHIVRYRGDSVARRAAQITPQPNGAFTPIIFNDQIAYRAGLTDLPAGADENVLFYFKQRIISPSRLAGTVVLVHETIDQVKEPRSAWVYNAGQRRVRRAPQLSYDGPGTASDGLRTADNLDMYNGSPDRYEWTLVGKQEMYIPYNSYKAEDPSLKYSDIIRAGHVEPSVTRYELHRVWVVDATLKSTTRHIYAKRRFYIDEDSWQAAMIDLYDARGNLWRVQQAYGMQYYNVPAFFYAFEAIYDLNSARYLVTGLKNEETSGFVFNKPMSKQDFNPNELRSSGVR
jgi:hypothetical protein